MPHDKKFQIKSIVPDQLNLALNNSISYISYRHCSFSVYCAPNMCYLHNFVA